MAGIDTIDASNFDVTLLGHGYYAESRSLLTDVHGLLHGVHAPRMRVGLEPVDDHWVMRP